MCMQLSEVLMTYRAAVSSVAFSQKISSITRSRENFSNFFINEKIKLFDAHSRNSFPMSPNRAIGLPFILNSYCSNLLDLNITKKLLNIQNASYFCKK